MNGLGMTHARGRLSAAAIFVLAPIAVIVARFTWGTDVPDPLPTHWGANGQVNGTIGASTFFWICVVISAGLAVSGVASVLSEQVDRSSRLVGGTAFGAWLLAAVYAQVVYVANGAADANEVSLPWQAGVLMVVVGIAGAVAVMALLPRAHRVAEIPVPEPSFGLAPQERVTWVGSGRSRALSLAALVLAIAAIACAFVSWGLAVALVVAAIIAAWIHVVTVRVDDDGLHTMWGPLGWPRSTVPLREIASAHTEHIDPSRWGGWGYRSTRRGRAAIARKGPGLVVERSSGTIYAVTIDHPDEAADVLNALLARNRS